MLVPNSRDDAVWANRRDHVSRLVLLKGLILSRVIAEYCILRHTRTNCRPKEYYTRLGWVAMMF